MKLLKRSKRRNPDKLLSDNHWPSCKRDADGYASEIRLHFEADDTVSRYLLVMTPTEARTLSDTLKSYLTRDSQ